VFASQKVQQNCPNPGCARRTANAKTAVALVFGTVLCLATGLPLTAETVKVKEVSSKPPPVEKLAPEKTKAAAPGQNWSADAADCVQPDIAEKSKVDGNELKDNESSALRSRENASSGDADEGPQSNSELITDKLKLSLEPKTDQASDPQAQQCHEEEGRQAREKENGDAAPNK